MTEQQSHEILIKLGKRISFLRNKKGLTQEKLAELAGRSTNHISKLELAMCNPSFDLLLNISFALDIELKELFNFDNTKQKINARKEFKEILEFESDKKLEILYNIYNALN